MANKRTDRAVKIGRDAVACRIVDRVLSCNLVGQSYV